MSLKHPALRIGIFLLFTFLCFTSCEKEWKIDTPPKNIIEIYIDYSSGQTDHMTDSATYMEINWNNGSGDGDMYEFKNYFKISTTPTTLLLYFTKEDLKVNSYTFIGSGTTAPGFGKLSYMILPNGSIAIGRPLIDYTQMDITKMYKVRKAFGESYYVDGTFKAKMAHGGTDSIIVRGSFQGALVQSTK